MRVSPRELQGLRRAGMLTRYAVLGPVAYVLADLPAEGTPGTGLEEPCVRDHHGIVLRGTFRVHHEDGRTESFEAGTVFYVPEGPPTHHFSWSSGAVVGGFARLASEADVQPAALEAMGFEIVSRPSVPLSPPSSVTLAGAVDPIRRPGTIDVEASVMGPWLFVRSIFGAQTGLATGRCELPHWGVVLDGAVAIHTRDAVELATAGDAFLAEPGHRFEVPDGATVIDYTPLDTIRPGVRVASWRRAAMSRVVGTQVTDRSASVEAPEDVREAARLLRPARVRLAPA